MKFCTNCGFKMNDDVKYCPKCGTEQPMQSFADNKSNDGKFSSGSEFDKDMSQSQSNNQQSWNNPNNQYSNGFGNNQTQSSPNYGSNMNNQYQGNGMGNGQQYQSNFNNSNRRKPNPKFKVGQPRHLSFTESVSYILANVFDFDPTVQDNQKSIFWWNYLLVCLVLLVLAPIIFSISPYLYTLIGSVGGGILTVASIMRRLNYLGKNKNIAWLMLIPTVNIYPAVLMLFDRKEGNY